MSYTRNGYRMLYNPNHPRSGKKDGMVYEHILIAEKILGRDILLGEDVHHKDENRLNNNEDNLIVFKTHEDHIRFHHSGVLELLPDGTYISPKRMIKCPVCELSFALRKAGDRYCSQVCFKKSQRKVVRPSKEELSVLIRENSFLALGAQFGVSDNTIRKWCKAYGLPYKKKDLIR